MLYNEPMKFLRENITLVTALLIPLFMVAAIFVTIQMSKNASTTSYDFIYAVDNDPYRSKTVYRVTDGKVEKFDNSEYFDTIPEPKIYLEIIEPKLFMHDISENKSTSISFEEAVKYTLDPNTISADGFNLRRGGENFTVFSLLTGVGDDAFNKYYLVNNKKVSQELNLQSGIDNYLNITFLGWIKN